MEGRNVILAEICAFAPIDVRNCIRKYNLASGRNYKALEKQFNTVPVSHLVETTNYLKPPHLRPNLNDYTKAGLIFIIITRIEGLFSDTCSTCKQSYCIKLDTPTLLDCENCGQEVHHTCLANKLDIPIEELTADIVKSKLNPFNIDEWAYICLPCKQKSHNEGDIKKTVLRAESNSRKQQESDTQSSNDQTSTHESGQIQTDPVSHEESSQNESDAQQSVDQSDVGNLGSPPDSGSIPPLPEDNSIRRKYSNKPPSHPDNFPNICRAYLKQSCSHGTGCTLAHPKFCQKLLHHGINAPDGCDGKTCSELHPQICQRSLKNKKCFYRDCKYMHLKGTVRKKPQAENPSSKQPGTLHEPGSNQDPGNRDPKTAQGSDPHTGNFLEAVRLLKGEILEVLDMRFALLKSEMMQVRPQQMIPPDKLQQPQYNATQQGQLPVAQFQLPQFPQLPQFQQLQHQVPSQMCPPPPQRMTPYQPQMGLIQPNLSSQFYQNFMPPYQLTQQA